MHSSGLKYGVVHSMLWKYEPKVRSSFIWSACVISASSSHLARSASDSTQNLICAYFKFAFIGCIKVNFSKGDIIKHFICRKALKIFELWVNELQQVTASLAYLAYKCHNNIFTDTTHYMIKFLIRKPKIIKALKIN